MSIWYYNKSSLMSAILEAKLQPENVFIFSKDNMSKGKSYSFLNSYDEFLEYQNTIEKKDRNFYEVIIGKKPRFEYYDIDNWDFEKQSTLRGFIGHFLSLRERFCKNFYMSDVIVVEACAYDSDMNLTKGSVHIIIKSLLFSDNTMAKEWAKQFSNFLKENDADFKIDLAVYSSFQNFRLEGSTKRGGNRFFKRVSGFGDTHKKTPISVDVDLTKIWDRETEIKKEREEREERRKTELLKIEGLDNPEIYEEVRNSILDGTHKKCDSEVPNRLRYNNFMSYCYSIIRTFGFDFLEKRWDEIWSLYRHCDDEKMNSQLNSLRNAPIEMDKTAFYNSFGEKKNFKIKAKIMLDKWVRPINTDKKNIIIRAYMGKGKTTSVKAYLERYPEKSVLFLTSRRSFATSLKSSLEGFVSYLDVKNLNKFNRLIIQVESLYKINRSYDILVIDECESILTQMTSIKTHKENILNNMECLKTLLLSSERNIFMDAFVSNKTLNFIERMGFVNETEYQIYKTLPEKRTAFILSDQNELLKSLISDLKEGKKIYFFCSSKKKLSETFIPTILHNSLNKKIKVYNSKELKNLSDVNSEWSESDLVATTSSITVGVNFDKRDHFDNIYIYMNACSKNRVRDVFQAHMRVRHIRDNVLKFCLNTKLYGISGDLPINKTELKNHVDLREEILQADYKFKHVKIDNIYKELYIDNVRERNLSIICLEKIFNKYLIDCGYELGTTDPVQYMFNLLPIQIVSDIPYDEIKPITKNEFQALNIKKQNEGVDEIENLQIEKYWFQMTIFEMRVEKECELWDLYRDYGKGKFNQIRFEKSNLEGKDVFTFSKEVNFMDKPIISRLKCVEQICQMLNIKNSAELCSISRETIKSKLEELKSMKEKIKNVFELRDRQKTDKFEEKEAVSLINEVLARWGYSKIEKGKRRRTRILGRQVDISDFALTEKNDVFKYIKPLEIRRTYNSLLIDGTSVLKLN